MGRSIDEIAEFCREENTFGALLLSGEWGSGKTYLLEHDLPMELGDAFAIIRISLFGETSVEAVRRKIKKTYFAQILDDMREHAAELSWDPAVPGNIAGSANSWVYKEGELSGVEKLYFRDPGEYIKLEPQIRDRVVILIFDDLERCHLSQAEILGCINEYCENLHIKTIIVANESKILNNKSKNQEEGKKDFLAYSEIKEKIIARTVRLAADYEGIITNIIRNYRTGQAGYVDFLNRNRRDIVSLVEDCEVRNIRSLRCGFQDFEKIFRICREEEQPEGEIRRYFTSFVLFVLLAKGGQISRSSVFGYGLNRLQQKYPGHYQDRYMPNCMKDWVMAGTWEPEAVRGEIRKNYELLLGTARPENRIRSLSLMELDDDTVMRGWDAYTSLIYTGELTLDEYVLLIRNRITAREFGYRWPAEIDGEAWEAGVEAAFRRICQSEVGYLLLRDRLEEALNRKCDPVEWKIYGKIVSFCDTKAYLTGMNRNRIMNALEQVDEQELFKCRNYELAGLDEELARAIIACYRQLTMNHRRMVFIDSVSRLLKNCRIRNAEVSDLGIEILKEDLQTILAEEQTMPLRAVSTEYFLRQCE